MVVDGMPTVLPFHRKVVSDPAFAPEGDDAFTIHTRWIETEFDNDIPAYDIPAADAAEVAPRQELVIEVGGKRIAVSLPADLQLGGGGSPGRQKAPKRTRSAGGGAAAGGDALTAPMQGTIVKVVAADGDTVAKGDTVLVIEAMKMEQPISAHKDGTLSGMTAEVGQTVTSGAVLAQITD